MKITVSYREEFTRVVDIPDDEKNKVEMAIEAFRISDEFEIGELLLDFFSITDDRGFEL